MLQMLLQQIESMTADWFTLADAFQLLHAVYAVENFLLALIQRHCNFHIIFFDSHREFCVPQRVSSIHRPRYLLARSIIRRHLKVNLVYSHPSIRVETFRSIRDESFRAYLTATGVYFVMCHDGAASGFSQTTAEPEEQGDREDASVKTQERLMKTGLRAMIYVLIRQGYNVALINGL